MQKAERERERWQEKPREREREGKTKRQKTQCNVSKLAKVPNKRRGRWVGGVAAILAEWQVTNLATIAGFHHARLPRWGRKIALDIRAGG
jgi:hypothetical protein